MQINPVYFRGPLLILLVLLLWGDPSHSKISEEPAVDEDVLDDVLEQEDGPASQRMKQILDSFGIPSKPPAGEPADEEKLVKGAATSFSEVKKLGQAPTPIESDSKPATGEDDGEELVVEGAVKSFSEVTKLDQAPTPIQSDSKPATGESDSEKLIVEGAVKSFSKVTKLGQAPTPIQSDSKPATGESDGEKLIVEGAVKSFSKVTKLGQAPTPFQLGPALLQKETAVDGKLDIGDSVKEQNIGEPDGEKLVVEGAVKSFSEFTKLGEASTPIQSDSKPPPAEADVEKLVDGAAKSYSEFTKRGEAPTPIQSDPTDALKVAIAEKAEVMPVVSCICVVFIFDMHCLVMS
jgi:hypothetical protein